MLVRPAPDVLAKCGVESRRVGEDVLAQQIETRRGLVVFRRPQERRGNPVRRGHGRDIAARSNEAGPLRRATPGAWRGVVIEHPRRIDIYERIEPPVPPGVLPPLRSPDPWEPLLPH